VPANLPSVNAIFLDGARRMRTESGLRRMCSSPSPTTFTETFGLTPIEAMAAGLPCLVSDWDGYMGHGARWRGRFASTLAGAGTAREDLIYAR